MTIFQLLGAWVLGSTVAASIAFTSGPPTQTTSSFVANPNAATANGAATLPLTLTVRDAYNNVVPGSSVSLTASGTSNTFGATSGVTDANGVFTTSLSSSVAQTKTIIASFGSGNTLSTSVTFVPGPASAATSTFVVNPNTTLANNSNTLTGVLTLLDAQSNSISGVLPTFTVSGVNTSVTVTGATSAAGISSASYKTASAQNENALVAAGGLNFVAPLNFISSPAAPTYSLLVANPNSATADGTASIALTFAARDASNNAIQGTAVSLTGSGGNNIFGAASGSTAADGNYTTTLTSTLAQTETITASFGSGSTATTTVQFLPGAASAATSSFLVNPNSTVANNSNSLTGVLTLLDARGNPIAGVTPSYAVSGSSTTVTPSGATSAAGQSSATYKTSLAQNENAITTAGGLSFAAPLVFVAGPVSQTASSLVASPNSLAGNGVTTSSLTTTARDAQGNAVAGASVALSASGSNNTFAATNGITGANGTFATTLKSNMAQTETITATLNGNITETATVKFAQAANQTTSSLSVSPSSQSACSPNYITATVTLRDAQSNPVANVTPSWTASGSSTSIVASGKTNAAGMASATFATSLAQTETAKVATGSVSLSQSVTFIAGSPNATTSFLYASPVRQIANNTNSIVASLVLRDACYNAVSGQTATFSASGSNTSVSAAAATNSAGLAQASYTTGTIQNQNALVSAGGFSLSTPIIFTDVPAQCVLSVNPNTRTADGNSAMALTATVTNGSSQPVPDIQVIFSSTGAAQSFAAQNVITTTSGQATSSLSSLYAGSNTLLAQAANVQCVSQGNFTTRSPYCVGNPNYNSATYATGAYPRAIAIADFNGDGMQDVAVTNFNSNTLSILLGTGTGTLQAQVSYAAGSQPRGVAVGDFNNDGNQDLAVTNSSSKTLSIFLGTGTGTFQTQVTYATGLSPEGVAIGDFNSDGKQDVAVANFNSSTFSVFLGTGTGTFQTQVTYTTGTQPTNLAIGDFNGDGKQDVAVSNFAGTLSNFLGTGTGTFQIQGTYTTSSNPYGVAIGDFNGDGKQDVAVTNLNSNTFGIFLGEGTGAFRAQINYATGVNPYKLATGDFNGDGMQDVAVTNFNSNTLSVLLGTGTGSFQTQVTYATGSGPFDIAVGDFNGDGKQDMAVTSDSNTIGVYLTICP